MRVIPIAATALTLTVLAGLGLIEAGQLPPRDTRAPAPPTRPAPTAASRPDARISGALVDQSGNPLRSALIRVAGPAEHIVWTDGEGRYEVTGLAEGRYLVSAEKTGYVAVENPPRSGGSQWMEIEDHQVVENINLSLRKGGVLVARVLDEAGEPVSGVVVQVLESRNVAGQRRLSSVTGVSTGTTDDRGVARVAGLGQGEYYASALLGRPGVMSPLADGRRYSMVTYYPSAPSPQEAQPVSLSLGIERAIELVLAAERTPTLVTPSPAQASSGFAIRGRVVSAQTGAPLARAHVALTNASPSRNGAALTNARGEYELRNVQPGAYTISATKSGFVSLASGQRKPGDAPRRVVVTDKGMPDPIDFVLPPTGVIVVHVVDDLGEPLAGVVANVLQRAFRDGASQLLPVGDVSLLVGQVTDDLGQIRLTGFQPGAYYVSAQVRFIPARAAQQRDARGYRETFYPGVPVIEQAVPVSLGSGQELVVPIQMGPPEPIAQVTGVVTRSDGTRAQGARLVLTTERGQFIATTSSDGGGGFSWSPLYPGDYLVEVEHALSGEVGSAQFSVSGEDISDLFVATRSAALVQGRLLFEGGAPPSGPGGFAFSVTRYPGDRINPRFTIRDDWTFEGVGANGSRTFRLRSAPDGWMLKSVTLDGRDVTDTAIDFDALPSVSNLEVTVTRIQATVTGRAVNTRNSPITDYAVIVFPEDRQQWTNSRFFGTAVADAQGRFTVTALPPGRYLAAAVDGLGRGQEYDPEFLERMSPAALSITLREGESRTVTLPVNIN